MLCVTHGVTIHQCHQRRHRIAHCSINLINCGQSYEYRPALVNGVLQWVLRPVYHLGYWIQRLIRRIRAATVDFYVGGYNVATLGNEPYFVDLAYLVDLPN